MTQRYVTARRGVDPQFYLNTDELWQPPFDTIETPSYLVIDPGLSKEGGCGWALFSVLGNKLVEPLYAGVLLRVMEEWQEQAYLNYTLLQNMVRRVNLVGVAVEYPSYWPGSPRSRAALTSGALGKVFYQAGQLSILHPFTRLLSVSEWKHNKSKTETYYEVEAALGKARLTKLLGKNPDNNAVDAVAMGLYLKRSGL